MSAETAAVLDEAANMIRRNGFNKGSFCATDASIKPKAKSRRPCCVRGAINLAANGRDPEKLSDVGEAAHSALLRHLNWQTDSVADWNDVPERTVEEVLAALEGAARAERETP